MAFPTKEKAAEIVALYRGEFEPSLGEVAAAAGVSDKMVRLCLDRAGVKLRETSGGPFEAQAEPAAVADVTSSPEFKSAVAAAVAEAFALMAPAAANSGDKPGDMGEFMGAFKQFAEAMNRQQAGYSKPLAPEEIAERAEGEAEFFDLIEAAQDAVENFGRRGARDRELVPYYIIGEGGFFTQTENGEELFSPGQPIYLTVPPAIDFEPLNDVAARIMAAQRKWLGAEPRDLGEMLAGAQMRLLGRDPEEPDRKTSRRARQVVEPDGDPGIAKVGPKHIMGAAVTAQADDGRANFAITKGHVARPVSGPVFAN